jgi:trehalose/maltose transport system substrate-binding protein
MVSAYSKNPGVAADLVRYLTSQEAQKKRAIELSQLPTRPEVYKDSEVLAKNPWFANAVEILSNAIARPSTVTGADYNQVSTVFFQSVNKVLAGSETAQEAVTDVERVAKRVGR